MFDFSAPKQYTTTAKGKEYTKWKSRYRDGAGKRKWSPGFNTKRELIAWIDAHGGRARTAISGDDPIRFRDFAERYLDDSLNSGRDGKAPSEPVTVAGNRRTVEVVLNPIIGDLQVRKITTDNMRNLRDQLLTKHKSRRTAQMYFNQAKAILKYAVSLDVISAVPGAELTITLDKRQKKSLEIYTIDEMQKLTALGKQWHNSGGGVGVAWQRYYVLYLILYKTGLRISEALGLQWTDFSPDWSTADIQRKIAMPVEGVEPGDRAGAPKTANGYRTIPIPQDVIPYLLKWRRQTNSKWLFPTKDGHPIQYSQVRNKMWLRLTDEAKVPRKGLHSLRHFYASQCIASNVSLFHLSAMLGHHSVAFTQDVYGHLTSEWAEERTKIANKMADIVPA